MNIQKISAVTAPPADIWSLPAPEFQEGGSAVEGRELPLSYYWSLVWRQRWRILSFVVITTSVITIFTLTRPKEYDATAMLRVDPLSSPLVGSDQRNGQVDANLMVTTEAKVLMSPEVVQGVIDRLNLANDPEFAVTSSAPNGRPTPVQAPAKLLEAVTKRISIDQPAGTVLLNLTVRTHRPDLSALAANGLAAEFLTHENQTRAKALTDSSQSMAGQLDSMRALMESDQIALVNYEAKSDVIDADDRTNIYQARLSAINDDLGKAQSARMQLEADYRVATDGGLDALLASNLGQQLIPERNRLVDDQRTLARDATIYGPRHPAYVQQEELVQHDQQALDQAAALVGQQVTDQYRAALGREALIDAALQSQKAEFDAFNMRAIQYHALKAAADSSSRLYYDLQQRIQDATVAAGLRSEDVSVISAAQPPVKPAAPHPLLVGLLALFGTAFLGIAAAIVGGLLDSTVASAEQVESRFGVQVVGVLPDVPSAQVAAGLRSLQHGTLKDGLEPAQHHLPYQESVFSLYSAIQFATDSNSSIIAVTSSLPGEGKSTLTCHLAMISAALGRRTVVVDADLRKPSVHRITQLSNRKGLSSVLLNTANLTEALQTSGPNLSVLAAGPPPTNPTELLHMGLGQVLEELQGRFECVLVDCPPMLGFGDSVRIISLAQSVLLVAHAGQTQRAQLAASLRLVKSVRAHLLGIVLNRIGKEQTGHYGYYNKYYYRKAEEDEENTDVAD